MNDKRYGGSRYMGDKVTRINLEPDKPALDGSHLGKLANLYLEDIRTFLSLRVCGIPKRMRRRRIVILLMFGSGKTWQES